jgi:septum site-determining protein MinD
MENKMTRLIVVASGKGGVGKTTTAINLGTALTNFGREVIILDGDLNTANIGLYLGAPVVPVTLHDVINNDKEINEAVYLHPSGLKIIPGSISIEQMKEGNHEKLVDSFEKLKDKAEVIIIDTPPGLGEDTLKIIKAADDAIIVTNPELPAITDALKTIKMAEKMGTRVAGVVLTKFKNDKINLSIDNVEAILEKPVIGIIPHDDNVRKAVKMKHPVTFSHPNSNASIGYKRLAANLLGEKYEESMIKKDGFFSYMLKVFGLR